MLRSLGVPFPAPQVLPVRLPLFPLQVGVPVDKGWGPETLWQPSATLVMSARLSQHAQPVMSAWLSPHTLLVTCAVGPQHALLLMSALGRGSLLPISQ